MSIRWSLPLAAVHCGLLTVKHAWSRGQVTTFDDSCFATAGPTLWNSLPKQFWQPDNTFGKFM